MVPLAPQRANTYKRKYLLIWGLVLLKHAFCRQQREARSSVLAANWIPQASVLRSAGTDFAPQHGFNSTPAHRNGGCKFSLEGILLALYRPFRWKTQLPNDSWNFCEVWLRKRTHVVSSPFFSLCSSDSWGGSWDSWQLRVFWVWKLLINY